MHPWSDETQLGRLYIRAAEDAVWSDACAVQRCLVPSQLLIGLKSVYMLHLFIISYSLFSNVHQNTGTFFKSLFLISNY